MESTRTSSFGDILFSLLIVIGGATLIVIAALADPVSYNSETVSFFGWTVPASCAFKKATGVPCSGCGLTRSWISFVHGNLALSFYFNPTGPLLLFYLIIQMVRHSILIFRNGKKFAPTFERMLDLAFLPILGLHIFAWIARVFLEIF